MNIAIVGGGVTGLCLGYYLSSQGARVDIFEATGSLGGLAGTVSIRPGVSIDRYYHTILSSDRHLIGLCHELGIADLLRFHETRTGFYTPDGIYSMNNMVDFLRFPPLNWIDRFRLGVTIFRAQLIRDWRGLEKISVEAWLKQWSGAKTFNNLWRPMLKAKFDGGFENTPATYIWSRLVRMKSARGGAAQKEMAGHLIGGYMTLVTALADCIKSNGGNVYLNTPVEEVHLENGKTTGVRVKSEFFLYDTVVVTLPIPLYRQLIPQANPDYLKLLDRTNYLGLICPVMALDRPLTDYWTLNIADDTIPFTGVIETTAYIDPQYVGGYHLVYLPKYTDPRGKWFCLSDEEIQHIWIDNLENMFPRFDRSWIQYFEVNREICVEPLHPLYGENLIPPLVTPFENLFLVNTAQIYPALTNCESITRYTREATKAIISFHQGWKNETLKTNRLSVF